SIFLDDAGEEIAGTINYATSLFNKDTITRMIDHFIHLVEQLMDNPGIAYGEISLLSQEEHHKMVYQ
ncbi:condensation domain-containing protein, partial [Sinomicrobium oceani]|uniref:condensation domain-containing protein n=1 Tax=Sinomicrobium oceani TaxID=1150368 RepID=UPI00227D5ECC